MDQFKVQLYLLNKKFKSVIFYVKTHGKSKTGSEKRLQVDYMKLALTTYQNIITLSLVK